MSAPISLPSSVSLSTRTTMRWLSTKSTEPDRRATMTAPESRAVMYSMPVPTKGARALSSGTAWRCMFDPIRARFASSFSRNGMSEAGIDRRVRLRDDVLILFPRRQVEGVGLDFHALLLRLALFVHHLVGFDDVACLVLAAGGVSDDDVVGDAAVLDLPVRRLDEAE